jgi:hypothetical protein
MSEKPRYYITTAISYPNGPPHIGHAYEVIATDAMENAAQKCVALITAVLITVILRHGQFRIRASVAIY